MRRPVIDLLRKGGVIVYTTPHVSVADAVAQMTFHNVGSVLILENHRDLVGIFTERDLARRVVLPGLSPQETLIGEVMSRNVMTVSKDTPRAQVHMMMQDHHIRHIPITHDGAILGVISLRDVLRFDNREKHATIQQLEEYIQYSYPA